MSMNPSTEPNPAATTATNLDHLYDQLLWLEAILHQGSKEETLEAFDADTELLLSEVFGNPSKIREAYVYAELGEAGGWNNLPEEARLDGDQDVVRLSLQQRKRVLEQAMAELQSGRNT